MFKKKIMQCFQRVAGRIDTQNHTVVLHLPDTRPVDVLCLLWMPLGLSEAEESKKNDWSIGPKRQLQVAVMQKAILWVKKGFISSALKEVCFPLRLSLVVNN